MSTLLLLTLTTTTTMTCDDALHARYSKTLDCSQHRDMCSYAPILRRLASHGNSVVEMGVRGVVSSWALLLGLHEAPVTSGSKWLVSVDKAPIDFKAPMKTGRACGVNVTFVQHDSATVLLPPSYDLLFIDTMHAYPHLKRELNAHAHAARRYIALHDTNIDGAQSDVLRMGGTKAVPRVSKATGYAQAELVRGLQPAIDEFLVQHTEWTLLEHHGGYCGLTVLVRHDTVRPGGRAFFQKSWWRRWLEA